jgi:hypothetical protein
LWGIDNSTRRFYASVTMPGRSIADVATYMYGSPDAAVALRATNGNLGDMLAPGTVLLPSGDPLSAGARTALQAALDNGTILRSDHMPASESGDLVVYRFSAAGQDYELTGAQMQGMLKGLAVYITRKANYFKGLAEVGLDVQRDHIKNTNSVIRGILEFEADVSPPSESLWNTPIANAETIVGALSGDLTPQLVASNAALLRTVAEGYSDANGRWQNYIEGTISAGEVTVTVLEFTRDAAFVTAAALAAVLAAPIVIPATGVTLATGTAAVGLGALVGSGTYAGLEFGSSAGGQALANTGTSKGVNWSEAGERAKTGAWRGAVSGAVAAGAALAAPGAAAWVAARGFGLTAEGLAAAGTGTRVAVGFFSGIVVGVPAGALDSAITNVPDLAAGKLSGQQYLERIGWGAASGAAFGGLFGAVGGLKAPPPRAPGTAIEPATPTTPTAPQTATPPAGAASPDLVINPPAVDPVTGQVSQTATHLPSGEQVRIDFDPATGRLTGTRLSTGEVVVIRPGTGTPLLPESGTVSPTSPDSITPVGSAQMVPQGSAVVPSRTGGQPVITPAPRPIPRLGPGNPTARTLQQIRNMRGRGKWEAGEQYVTELYGANPQEHFPVPMQEGQFPVTTPGGRFVDAPVPTARGGRLAVEVKTYNRWRTVNGAAEQREVPLSDHIREQINKDVALRAADPNFDPRWVFLDAPPSQALRDYLTAANIAFVIH